MKVLIVTQYFWPEYFRVNDLAIELSKKNFEVDILTGYPNYPKGKFYDEFLLNREKFNQLDNIKIYRVPIIPRGSDSKFQLVLNYLSFLFTGIIFGSFLLRKKKYDVIITFATSPIIVAIISIFLSKLKRTKHVIWVLDLWPNVLSDLNIIKEKSNIYKIFNKIVNFIYKNSDIILCQSLSFKKIIKNLNANLNKKLYYFPSWPEDIDHKEKENKENIELIDNNFTNIVFAGNVGESQNFNLVAKVIQATREEKIKFYILGEGRDYKSLTKIKVQKDLKNLHLLGLKKFEDIQYYLNNADYLMISLQYKQTFNSTIPGKFQTYLKYKKPILGLLGGETNRIINKYKIGKAFNYYDDDTYTKDIVNFFKNEKLEIKKSSYDILLKIYSKKRGIKKLINILNILMKKNNFFIKMIFDQSRIDYRNNFIVSGLNLAFLGYYSSKKLLIHESMILWPDGFFKKRFFPQDIKKIPGRDFLNRLQFNNINRIVVLGNLHKISKDYLEKKFNINVTHVQLPMGNIDDFIKYIPVFKKDDICIITLPTPKQENLACYIADSQKYYKIFCFGGAINMASGLEKPLPEKFNKYFFAESLWRLQYDTYRRVKRLIETLIYYIIGEVSGVYNKIKIK